MENLWEVAISLTGIGGIGAFVFYSLYKNWLKLPIHQPLTKEQLYKLFRLFLILTFLFALSTLIVYFVIVKSSNASTDLAEIQNFKKHYDKYAKKYEDKISKLDKSIILDNLEAIKLVSNRNEYSDIIIDAVNNTHDAHSDIEQITAFFDRMLTCEKNKEPGCSKKMINSYFGNDIHDIWYSYGSYIKTMRDNGYPKLGQLVQARANELHLRLDKL